MASVRQPWPLLISPNETTSRPVFDAPDRARFKKCGSTAPHSRVSTQLRKGSKADEVDGSRSRHLSAKMGLLSGNPRKEPSAMQIAAMSLDMAKRVFQVHAVEVSGDVLVRKAV